MQFDAKLLLLIGLGLVAAYHVVSLVRGLPKLGSVKPTPGLILHGTVTDFLDTLGIGSFATSTAIFRATKLVKDALIPGTLNAGHTMSTLAQAFIYTQVVEVEPITLIGMIIAAVVGSYVGAGLVARWPTQRIQLGMGLCLAGAALLTAAQASGTLPGGGEAIGLTGAKLGIALFGNFVLGVLMTIGIGLYGPCLVLVSILGMNPAAGFPIMMGSCAFLMPFASDRFIRLGKVDPKAVVGNIIGGLPAVLVAAYIVKSLPLTALRWLVAVVVAYTAITLIMAARRKTEEAAA
ncbi:MAG: sulfite exporter TauE/SafE family protein [Gemmatimonadaceae bacterium]|uniref:sulfite exporter TauE/SafE family protein n=1 Tax=Gemmatimonas sp. TaxID=1962908 RepID=UPI001D4F67B5|nr:sulfite exporter TauE/SafE family protein [Gemmatimonas sp.]NCW44381.1 sulfite exporter TauE/SafE family protein [Gemmatimonadaceae bacterium]